MTTQTMDIMERAEMLPIDLRLELVDRLLESISPLTNSQNGKRWKRSYAVRIRISGIRICLFPLRCRIYS